MRTFVSNYVGKEGAFVRVCLAFCVCVPLERIVFLMYVTARCSGYLVTAPSVAVGKPRGIVLVITDLNALI